LWDSILKLQTSCTWLQPPVSMNWLNWYVRLRDMSRLLSSCLLSPQVSVTGSASPTFMNIYYKAEINLERGIERAFAGL
jgi:hypothetical protein